jgi:hypothetical protein
LANLSQFFSILTDDIGAPCQALQIIFEMHSQKTNQKRAIRVAKHIFIFIFSF